jgi:hypothetical protein
MQSEEKTKKNNRNFRSFIFLSSLLSLSVQNLSLLSNRHVTAIGCAAAARAAFDLSSAIAAEPQRMLFFLFFFFFSQWTQAKYTEERRADAQRRQCRHVRLFVSQREREREEEDNTHSKREMDRHSRKR